MKWLLLFAIIIVRISPACAQIQYGTIGVAYLAKDKIVMAADSRGMWVGPNPNSLPDDNQCKIAAPHGKLIFVSSGNVGYRGGGSDPVESWLNIDEIRNAFDKASLHAGTSLIFGTAVEWTRSIVAHFESLRLAHPEQIVEMALKGKGTLTLAMFGGINDVGTPLLFGTKIRYQEPNILSDTTQLSCSFCSIGEAEIAAEFTDLISARAKQEAETWKPAKGANPADYDILKTMRLVELTIELHQGNDVGGKIDAVEMDKDGSVRWFALKENCAKD